MSTRWEGHGELGSLRVRRFRGGWRCTARGKGVVALQAAALDLDGGGAWSAVHRRRRRGAGRRKCGPGARSVARRRSGAGAARVRQRRGGAGVAAAERRTGAGCRATVSRDEEKQSVRLTRGPAERVKRKQNERARQP